MSDPIDFDAEEPEPYGPTSEDIDQMAAASREELEGVDAMVLGACSHRFQKVAKIVGLLFKEFERQHENLPFVLLQARMEHLEEIGIVEIAGDVWRMGRSEIRLAPRKDTSAG